jgi:hypothetical protein
MNPEPMPLSMVAENFQQEATIAAVKYLQELGTLDLPDGEPEVVRIEATGQIHETQFEVLTNYIFRWGDRRMKFGLHANIQFFENGNIDSQFFLHFVHEPVGIPEPLARFIYLRRAGEQQGEITYAE